MIPDLATVNYYDSQVGVMLGNVDGTFQAALNTTTGSSPISLAVGDFDGDSALDLATFGYGGLSIHLGNGDGTFDAPTNIGLGDYPSSVAVGDFNDDDKLDLVATTNSFVPDDWYYGHYEGRANVLLGNGQGSFAGPQVTELGYGSHTGATVADFNEDGKDDFAAVDSTSLLKVALANADGSLQAPDSYGTDWNPHAVAVGDVDSDGIIDLVTSNNSSVSVLLGNGAGDTGDGTFQAARSSNIGSYPSSVATGDFNVDGKLDLAVSGNRWVSVYYPGYGYYGHYENEASVLLGYDNGHFAAPESTFVEYGWGSGIISADFNGDLSRDLALTNTDYYQLSVLINDESWLPLPPPAVSVTDSTVDEGHSGATNANFTISIPFAHTADLTVHYETADGSATAGSDYTAVSGDVIIPAGTTSVAIPVAVHGDRTGEWDESFVVNISSAEAPVADSQGFASIADDEPQASLGDATVTEGNTGSTSATFSVTLSRAYDQAVSIQYSTVDGSAVAGSDFTGLTNATMTIPAGEMSADITIAVHGDRRAEDIEWYNVNLTSSPTALITDDNGLGYIYDNEPRIWIEDVTKNEGTGKGKNVFPTEFLFRVHLSEAYDQAVTVNFSTANGSATVAGNDYIARSGTLTIPAGQTTGTIAISVKADSSRENDEWFALNLTSSSTNAFLLDTQGTGWILDDDRHGKRR